MQTGMVKIPELNAYLLLEGVAPDPSLGLEFVPGGWIEIPAGVFDQSEGEEYRPQNLGVCRTDPRHFRAFKSPEELEPAGFQPTGLIYGGAYSPTMWERFVEGLPGLRAFAAIPDDPPEAIEEAMRLIREARQPWPGS